MTDNDRGGPVSGGDHNQGEGRELTVENAGPNHCGLGICAAMEGHEGTCDEASGWVLDESEIRAMSMWAAFQRVRREVVKPRTDPQRDFDMAPVME